MLSLVGVILKGIRMIAPHLIALAFLMGMVIAEAAGGWLVGVWTAVERASTKYLEFAARNGLNDSRYDQVLYYGACVLAVVELLIGWVLCSYLTVWLIRVIF